MRQQVINKTAKQMRAEKRDKRVRKLTVWSVVLLSGLCLGAIWQDRALAPPVHDGMQAGLSTVLDYINESDALSEMLAGLQEGYDDLTSGS